MRKTVIFKWDDFFVHNQNLNSILVMTKHIYLLTIKIVDFSKDETSCENLKLLFEFCEHINFGFYQDVEDTCRKITESEIST